MAGLLVAARASEWAVPAVQGPRDELAVYPLAVRAVPALRRGEAGEEVAVKPKVPNTISDKKRAQLARREKPPEGGPFGKKAIERRKASEVQRKKSRWS